MSVHVRQQIREAVCAVLSGKTDAGTTVYSSRVIAHDVLPDITVWTLNDEVDHEKDIKGPIECHELDVFIEVRVKEVNNFDDALDDICLDIETELKLSAVYLTVAGEGEELDVNYTLGNLIKRLDLQGTSIDSGEEEKAVGKATIKYTAEYRIDKNAPSIAL